MNIIIFIAFLIGVLIVGYDGMFKGEPALVAAVAVILISTAPMVLFQQKMKEKKILMTLSLIGVVAGSIYLWFLTDGGLFFGSK